MSSVCIHQPLTESSKAFIVHRGTAKRLYTGTQCKAVVTGHSDKNNAVQSAHTKVYNCAKEHRMRLMQLFPLNLHSHSMKATYTPVRVKSSARLLLGSVEDAVPQWPRLDVCRPRRGETWTLDGCFAGGGNLIRWPGEPLPGRNAAGMVSGSAWSGGEEAALWSGRWCSLLSAATILWDTVSQVYRRQEENISILLLISFRAIYNDDHHETM